MSIQKKCIGLFMLFLGLAVGIAATGTTRKPRVPDGPSETTAVMPKLKAASHERLSATSLTRKRTQHKGVKRRGTARLRESSVIGNSFQSAAGSSGLPELCGYVVDNDNFSEDNMPCGLYRLPQSGGASAELIFGGIMGQGGCVRIGGTYYVVGYSYIFGTYYVSVVAYDLETGGMSGFWQSEDMSIVCPAGYACDPTDSTVYGIGFDSAGTGFQLSSITFGDQVTSTCIAPLEGLWNSIVCDKDGQLYGISYDVELQGEDFVATKSYLNRIDKHTGAVTRVGETGCAPQYVSSSTIDRATGRMFWNLCAADGSAYMCEVDLTTGAATPLFRLKDNDEVLGMYAAEPSADKDAPGECSDLEVRFDGASLSGEVALTSPSALYGGAPGTGRLTLHVCANVREIAAKDAGWGEHVAIPVDLGETGAGSYDFEVFASNAAGNGPKTVIRKIWVGPDVPESPAAGLTYTGTDMNVSWAPVTTSVNGGYIDVDDMTYTVRRMDGSVAAEGLASTSFSETVGTPDDFTTYFYTVQAVCGGKTSAPSKTNLVSLGAIKPPYTSDYAGTGLTGWTVIDANNDGTVWTVEDDVVRIRYSLEVMDDWLVTPAVRLEAGKHYNISFSALTTTTIYPERLEVKYGDSPEPDALTATLFEPTTISGQKPMLVNMMLVPEKDGLYYIGFHGISDANMYNLTLSDITIEAGLDSGVPGVATDVTVTPRPLDLEADVAMTMPLTTLGGQPLESISEAVVSRDGKVVHTFNSAAPGERVSFTDKFDATGNVTYTIVCHNGKGAGLKTSVTAFIGFDKPQSPANVAIRSTAKDGEALVTWDAVTSDLNGTALPESKVTYIIAVPGGNGWTPLESGVTGTSYRYQAVQEGSQAFVQVAVFAETSEGTGLGSMTDMVPIGTPYNGVEESFANGGISYRWGLNPIGEGAFQVFDDKTMTNVKSCDNDNGFGAIFTQYVDDGAELLSGRISVKDAENPGISFYTYNYKDNVYDKNLLSVMVRADGETDFVELLSGTVVDLCGSDNPGWNKITVSLADYAGKIIDMKIKGVIKTHGYIPIDRISVGSQPARDIKVTGISAPSAVKGGNSYKVTVTVGNDGMKTAEDYKLRLYADGNLLAEADGPVIKTGERASYSFKCVMSPVIENPFALHVKADYDGDADTGNNSSAQVTVTPVRSTMPAPTGLSAESGEGEIALDWTAPDLKKMEAMPVTDDFEDGDPFSPGYGDWIFIDGDGSPVGGFRDIDMPGITTGETTGSFWVWDHARLGYSGFEAHSGQKYLFSLYNAGESPLRNDDWAISPELTGEAQTISFYARNYNPDAPETMGIYYSTGSADPSEFIQVGGDIEIQESFGEWKYYEFSLPAGARRFAIVCKSLGQYMLMVDDVTYTPASADPSGFRLAGYNVYRDGQKINDSLLLSTRYADKSVEDNNSYVYVVTAVYEDKRESAGSEEVSVDYRPASVDNLTGNGGITIYRDGHDIRILNAVGHEVTVTAASGTVVYRAAGADAMTIRVDDGIYIVTAAGRSVKFVIR